MANIIAAGNTQASVEFTLTAGTPTTVFLSGANGLGPDARASIQQKSAAGLYTPLGELNEAQPALTIYGGGTLRVTRQASSDNYAVDRD